MQKWFQILGLMTFVLGVVLLLSNLFQPRLLCTEVMDKGTVSAYLLPDRAERLPDIGFSAGLLLIGVLGIYTDIYRPQRSSRNP